MFVCALAAPGDRPRQDGNSHISTIRWSVVYLVRGSHRRPVILRQLDGDPSPLIDSEKRGA